MIAVTEDELLTTALVYDFDGTLAPGNIQEHSLLPRYLGLSKEAFWREVSERKQRDNADQILVYMRLLLEQARARELPLTAEVLQEHAAQTPLFAGVEAWFSRIDAHARARGLRLEHYVISSGNEEMIRGTSIGSVFAHVFGCRYAYDDAGQAVWPAVTINYTTKTQYLFRINKGVFDIWNDEGVNRWQPMGERPIPFSRMIYLGDGDTDIPSMKMVRHQGGHSVAVFDPDSWSDQATQRKIYNLIAEDRAHFVVPADYSVGSQLDVTIKGILGRIARDEAGYRGDAE
jgi:phosphoserine phosphatase